MSIQWRTTPLVVDLDRDGLDDLVAIDHEGYLAWYRRTRSDSGRLGLQPLLDRAAQLGVLAEPLRERDVGECALRSSVVIGPVEQIGRSPEPQHPSRRLRRHADQGVGG